MEKKLVGLLELETADLECFLDKRASVLEGLKDRDNCYPMVRN
jgi:hypothetical protein